MKAHIKYVHRKYLRKSSNYELFVQKKKIKALKIFFKKKTSDTKN